MTATRATRATRARARADQAEARAELSTSARHPIEDHAAGAQAFIATRCNEIGDWAVIDSNAGWRCPDFWDGTAWRPLVQGVPQSDLKDQASATGTLPISRTLAAVRLTKTRHAS